jgi:hypothetical protein
MLAHDLIQEPLRIFGNHAVVSRLSTGHRNHSHMTIIDGAAQQKAGGWRRLVANSAEKSRGWIC